MIRINKNFSNLKENYIFAEVNKKVRKFKESNKNAELIDLGIGDVVLPIVMPIVKVLEDSVKSISKKKTMHGYGPYEGYKWLRDVISKDYKNRTNFSDLSLKRGLSISIDPDEIFIGPGTKEDMGGILELFDNNQEVLIPDPVYPAYCDTSTIEGFKINFVNAIESENFLATPKKIKPNSSIIYICSPNNPTGAAYTREKLKLWVDFALNSGSVILFDGAYEAFVSEENIVRSIYEIPGSRRCAIEFRSFSKMAGFTGLRCSYVVIPRELKLNETHLIDLWKRRISFKTNGVSYLSQRAAESVYQEDTQLELEKNINYYKENFKTISKSLDSINLKYFGGKNSPYVWVKCSYNKSSWEFFDYLLEKLNIVVIPGCGFGENGEGYFRISCFVEHEKVNQVAEKIKSIF
ncbi:MAG: LL-diaminopimelate aminotransferase [Candidatus Improbicoccus pseudotrichonymphae]|uniref:LL-diaminopimelate aminotransferase n=1 Tax=Candidatus Improbicoccus pseudotrichonymphae TaxID=3033792 RepID=A0AA48I3A7_9FIRM|nr:MAG: LL-diaminopimelate aminotransferase [Candidatus Improbicoccus pseudotrichonymphae]